MKRNVSQKIDDKIFKEYAQKVGIFLKAGTSKGANYDPFRNTEEVILKSNPRFIKAIVRDVSPEKLIMKELGWTITGAKELIIKQRDINAIKISQKITIDGIDYYKYHDSIGNKLLIFKRSFGYSRVIIFRKDS